VAIAEITAAINGLKVAMDIGKGLLAVDKSMEQATFKIQIAELMSSLADARVSVTEAQNVVEAKDAEIRRLQDAVANKAKVTRVKNGYYELNELGEAAGDPYCLRCWEADHRLVHLALGARFHDPALCPQCKSNFNGHQAHRI
jgi:hypothetical protein